MLTIRQTKFAKSRQLPLHPSTVEAQRYRRLRNRHIVVTLETPFFVASKGKLLGQGLRARSVERIFASLRDRLGWANRGGTMRRGSTIFATMHSFGICAALATTCAKKGFRRRFLAQVGYVAQRLHLAVRSASKKMGDLAKRAISPHTIRHTAAMHLLQSGVDISVIRCGWVMNDPQPRICTLRQTWQ